MYPRFGTARQMIFRKTVLAFFLLSVPSTFAATIAIGIGGFSSATTVVDFVGPSANPYREAGATFASGMQNVSGGTLNVTDFLNPVLSVDLPFASNRVGLTNRGALPLIITLQLFGGAGLMNPVDSFGPVTVNPFDPNQPLINSFLGLQSDIQFQSLRVTATNSFSLADFRFEAVPEPAGGVVTLIGLAALAGLTMVKTNR